MKKKKLFATIAIVALLTISISLISMMSLTPSFKEISGSLYKKESQTFENHTNISTDFILKTTKGKELSSQALRGKFLLVYFGSSYCPNTSLPHIIEMQNILQKLYKKYAKGIIEFLFITADPTKDTQDHLSDYFKRFDARIIALTGDEDKTNKVLKNFKAYDILFKDKVKTSQSEGISAEPICIITGSSPFYFIGKDGELIKHYNPYSTSLSIAKDILHYIKVS
jgi:protein SCO1/2